MPNIEWPKEKNEQRQCAELDRLLEQKKRREGIWVEILPKSTPFPEAKNAKA